MREKEPMIPIRIPHLAPGRLAEEQDDGVASTLDHVMNTSTVHVGRDL